MDTTGARRRLVFLLAVAFLWLSVGALPALAATNPILFITQVPRGADIGNPTHVTSSFGSHLGSTAAAGRGGDLYIRYTSGTLKNLTATAGFGSTDPTGFQGVTAIAVRDPSVYWDGSKALFSMVVGAPAMAGVGPTYFWQIYEVTGLAQNQTPVITKVAHQPLNANNVGPTYGSDDRVIFTSDLPRDGVSTHLYPQFDEYEAVATNTGVWSLDAVAGDLKLLNHAPSGDFTPFVDSFGRIIVTQWDHLQRDQLADNDSGGGITIECNKGTFYGTFNYDTEAVNSPFNLSDRSEIFPEPRVCRVDLLNGTVLTGNLFDRFFPWALNQDGTGGEVVNHLGRHELNSQVPASRNDDTNIATYNGQFARFNTSSIGSMFQIKEDPTQAGRYYGVDALEFNVHTAGQVFRLSAPPGTDADHIAVNYMTHRDTFGTANTANNSGHYRDPLPLADGTLIAAHTSTIPFEAPNATPQTSTYAFRLKTLSISGNGFFVAGSTLTSGISKTLSYYDGNNLVSYSGTMWELNPVEVRARTRPTPAATPLPQPEQSIFDSVGVSVSALQAYMVQNNLALAVSRNVTTRDDFDKQQPYNLHVPGGVTTTGASGTIYDISSLQFYQGDQRRGMTLGGPTPVPGRRVLATRLHDAAALAVTPPNNLAQGSVVLGSDGSMAAFVPARRAMTWQLNDPNGTGVVRERFWVTFQPGEVRVCTSCHGINQFDQAGQTAPTNPPQALATLLQFWKSVAVPTASPTSTGTSTPTASAPTATPTPAAVPATATSTASATTSLASPTPTLLPTATASPTMPNASPTVTPPATATPPPWSCTSGIGISSAHVGMRGAPPSLRLRGRAVIPKPWIGINPLLNGIRVRLDSAGGGTDDLIVGGGVRWKVNVAGTRWTYRDPNATQSGVTRLVVRDRSDVQSGEIRFSLSARGVTGVSLPLPPSVRTSILLGAANECATLLWGDPGTARPRCDVKPQRLMCR